jgi:ABC-2 type transport system permease protein
MLHGFWKLAWVETKVFVREPMGAIGSLLLPVVLFAALGRLMWSGEVGAADLEQAPFNLTILAALTIAVGAVLSLVAIMAIYREGGILKRLRATPLSPVTILGAHVVVKLAFTVVSLALLVVAGRRILPGAIDVNLVGFTAALLLGTASILSTGFVIASLVPTARFAQPIGAALFYPMIGLSGLFFPVDRMPDGLQVVAYCLPTTHAVSLMQGVWDGTPWCALWMHVAALVLIGTIATALAARVFRWE